MFSDLGKVLLLPSFGGLPQWAVVGEFSVLNIEMALFSAFELFQTMKTFLLQETHIPLVVLLMNPLFTTRYEQVSKIWLD